MTVRSTCRDVSASATNLCSETGASTNASARAAYLSANCSCDVEQHYQYRWDAVNRLSEARRYDRGSTRGGNSGSWQLQTRQQYEYDESNNRLLKRVQDGFSGSANGLDGQERMALYVAPGAFERRGLVTGTSSYDVEAPRRAETQYLVATPGGTARLIWAETNGAPGNGAFAVFNREARLTMNVTDLLQSTSAVIDLFDGDVLERGTYLPSGVRETRTLDEAQEAFPLEPLGFTGKEDDLEVGLMYFGHRYLMPHLGRWASPDPLQIHAGGGGEFGNSYHYVSGNLLQARDPDGLDIKMGVSSDQHEDTDTSTTGEQAIYDSGVEAAKELRTDAREVFGVEIYVNYRTDGDREGGQIVLTEASHLSRAERQGRLDRAEARARANLAAIHGHDAEAIESDLAIWREARERLLADLGSDRQVDVRLTTREPVGLSLRTSPSVHSAMHDDRRIGPFGGDDHIQMNPNHYQALRGSSPAARQSRGVLLDYVHERTHQQGCLGAGDCLRDSPTRDEDATRGHVDAIRRASGMPTRDDYARSSCSGPGSRCVLSGREYVEVGSASRLQ